MRRRSIPAPPVSRWEDWYQCWGYYCYCYWDAPTAIFGGNSNVNLNINSNNNVVLMAVVSYSSLLVQIQYVFSTSNFLLMWQDE